MSGPSTKGERTRLALLEAAIIRFAQDGSRRANVTEIARDVGIAAASVYAYFPSKQDLFVAALDADAEGLVQRAVDAIGDDFDADWMAILPALIGGLDAHPLARRVLAGAEGTAADRLLVLPAEARLRQRLAASLRAGQADAKVRADIDPDVIADGLTTLVIALLIGSLQTGGAAVATNRTEGIVAVLDASVHAPLAPRPDAASRPRHRTRTRR